MLLVGLGDLYIPAEVIAAGFANLARRGLEVRAIDWPLRDYEELQGYNLEIEKRGPEAAALPAPLGDAVREADVLVTHFCPLAADLIRACPHLKVIGVLRAGTQNVDLAAAGARGVTVFNTPGRNAEAVAEFAVGMILAECRNVGRAHAAMKRGQWRKDYYNWHFMPELSSSTVGIVGLGHIGRAVARKLSGFGCRILGHDPQVAAESTNGLAVEPVSLDRLLAQSDVVTLHARTAQGSPPLIGAAELARMKPRSYLINTSRADLIDERALCEALRTYAIAGAALDVFSVEPLPRDHPFLTLDNITLTPHMAGTTLEAYLGSVRLLAADIEKAWSTTDRPRFIVNPQAACGLRSLVEATGAPRRTADDDTRAV